MAVASDSTFSFLISWPHRDHNLISLKGCESVANRQVDVCFARHRLDTLTRQLHGQVFRDVLRVTEGLLVVGKPVQEALAYNGYHDLELVSVPDV